MTTRLFFFFFILFGLAVYSQDSMQTFISVRNTGVDEFHKLYPEYDGRGTIIIVLDTGVDPGIEGLTQTSTGEVKVIDVQDFTGEGDVKLYDAEIDEIDDKPAFINEEMNYNVFGADNLKYSAVDGKYYIGAFEEQSLINSESGAADLNGNGTETDKYMIVAFEALVEKNQSWIAYVDTDGDGDISDETPRTNYKDDLKSFTIKKEEGLTPLTFGLNIFPDEKRVSFHFDDGAHGTHCAGIAAGNNIGGSGLSGVAPGAYIISCKLGNNLYTGGATVTESMKKAYLYADKISKERKEPCIINMSFGIGSEIEGRSEIEIFLAQLLKDNPYLYVCTGNGNEGPGISTTGLPSASNYTLSSGAVLPREVGRDLYGTQLDRDIILYFSSRGGEVTKPDICSPGACTSTVPNWESRDIYWGTSMASPYSAGVVSLLMSTMVKEFPNIKIPSQLVFKAIREGATNMEGYNYLDQGPGYINVMNAYKLLKKYIENGEINNLETYSITSTAPNMPDGKAPNLYIRDGSFLKENEKFNFVIRRNNFQNADKFYRVYNIKCNEDWLIPIQHNIYIRNNQSAVVTVQFDKSKMSEPGIYSGKIKAFRDDKSNFPEFEMLVTLVIPYQFTMENDYSMNWKNKMVKTGDMNRYFINMPAGQTALNISLSRDRGKYTMTRYSLFNPDGERINGSSVLNSLDDETNVEDSYYNLPPGIYEVDVEGYFRAEEISQYNLEIKFSSIKRLDDKIISSEENTIEIINRFNSADKYYLGGNITGYERSHSVELQGSEHYYLPFTFTSGETSKTFTLHLSKEEFNKITDFAMLILDADGIAVASDALTYKDGSISMNNISTSDEEEFRLELIPAFTSATDNMTIDMTEETDFIDKKSIDVTYAGYNNVTLYPNIPVTLHCKFGEVSEAIPENANVTGKIYLVSAANEKTECELPIVVDIN